ncbi:tetratricopeptide repeat protein [Nonomuraea fuscirosea]|uniref:tetratricopeptide repeat protein n=1 Tax=Nonomuraea fuscirosea TaxID=1291556 RepID=UPI0033F0909C
MVTDRTQEADDSAGLPGAVAAEAGDYEEALRLLEKVKPVDPKQQHAVLLLRLKLLVRMGRFHTAERTVKQYIPTCSPTQLLEMAQICSDADADLLAARLAARAAAGSPALWNAYHDQITYLEYENRPREALDVARLAVQRCSNRVEPWLDLARLAEQAGWRDEALRALDAALMCAPDDPSVLLSRGRLFLDLIRLAEAERAFEALPAQSWPAIVEEYHSHGFHDAALVAADWTLAVDPGNVEVRVARITCLNDVGRFDEAQQEWHDLRSRHSRAAPVILRLIEQGLLDEARDLAESPDLLIRLARAYIATDRLLDALAVAERALAIDPQDDAAHRATALCLLKLGRDNEAFPLLHTMPPEDAAALLGATVRDEEAITYWRLAVEAAPWNSYYSERLIIALTNAGRHREATRELRRLIGKRPKDPSGYLARQAALEERGKLWRAMRAARRAVAVAPDHLEAHSKYLGLLLTLGRFRRAEQVARALACRTPDGVEFLCQVARAMARMGRYRVSLGLSHEALRLDPSSRRPLEVHASTLYHLGQTAEANQITDQLVIMGGNGPRALLDTARWLSGIDEDARGVAYARRALAAVPDNAEAIEVLASLLYYSDQETEATHVLRQGLAAHPASVDLWDWLVSAADPRDAPDLAAEALAAFPESCHGGLLRTLAQALDHGPHGGEAALAYYERAYAADPDEFPALIRTLRDLDRPSAVMNLLAVARHPTTTRELTDYLEHLGLPVLAIGAQISATSPGMFWRIIGSPLRRLLRLLHSTERAALNQTVARWSALQVLDTISPVSASDLAEARAETEHYVLERIRITRRWWDVFYHLRILAAVAGAWAAWPLIQIVAPSISAGATLAGLTIASTLSAVLFRRGLRYIPAAALYGSCALAGVGLLRIFPTTAAEIAGATLLGFALAIVFRGSYVRLGSLVSNLMLSRRRRTSGMGATLDAICDVLNDHSRQEAGHLVEQVAQRVERDLPRWFTHTGTAGPQTTETLRGAARAVRELRLQVIGPGRDQVRDELRQLAQAVMAKDLSALRQIPEPQVQANIVGWKGRIRHVGRMLAVMALPILGVMAAGLVFGLDGDAYRSALLIATGWALVYLLLILDPTLRDKIETARSLLATVGIAPGAEPPTEPKAKTGPEGMGGEPRRP